MSMLKVIAAFGAVTSFAAQAVVISDSQIGLSQNSDSGYAITAIQQTAFDDQTILAFSKVDQSAHSTLTPVIWAADEEADYYLVEAGAAFTQQNITAGKFQPLFTTDHPYSLDVPYPGDFYLGVATTDPSEPVMTGSIPRNVWGWVHLKNDSSGLSMLGNAMAYGERGIIVGTTTAVPEAGAWVMSLVGLAGLAMVRRRGARSNKA